MATAMKKKKKKRTPEKNSVDFRQPTGHKEPERDGGARHG